MSYGYLSDEMMGLLREHVAGAEVWDLGAGILGRSHELVYLGARKVIAIDKERMPPASPGTPIETRRALFAEVQPPVGGIDVAFLGWPQNTSLVGLTELLVASRKVIYLGCNTGGTSCGNSSLFTHFYARQVLGHVPHARNSLIVYGGWRTGPRRPLPEEWAALHPEHMWTLEEATEAIRER